MGRRYFDHLHAEISVALDRRISRYDLWLAICDAGGDPDALDRTQVTRFVQQALGRLLREEGARLAPRARRRLERRLLRFDPDSPTPAEVLAHLLHPERNAA